MDSRITAALKRRCGPSRLIRRVTEPRKSRDLSVGPCTTPRIGRVIAAVIVGHRLRRPAIESRRTPRRSGSCRAVIHAAQTDNPSVFDDDDLVRCRYSRDPLRNDDDGCAAGYFSQRLANLCVGVHVQRREGVVEQIDRGAPDHRSGDGQPLSLSAGEIGSALCHRHLQAVLVGSHEPVGVRHPQRLPHLVGRSRRPCRTAGCPRRCRRTDSRAAVPNRITDHNCSMSRSRTSTRRRVPLRR